MVWNKISSPNITTWWFCPRTKNRKSSRRQETKWFNPQYICNVATDTRKKFFLLIGRLFLKWYKFYKIVNRNIVKVSIVWCIIKSRNKKILSRTEVKSLKKSCNRKEKTYFSLNCDCLQAIVIQYLPSMNKSTIAITSI